MTTRKMLPFGHLNAYHDDRALPKPAFWRLAIPQTTLDMWFGRYFNSMPHCHSVINTTIHGMRQVAPGRFRPLVEGGRSLADDYTIGMTVRRPGLFVPLFDGAQPENDLVRLYCRELNDWVQAHGRLPCSYFRSDPKQFFAVDRFDIERGKVRHPGCLQGGAGYPDRVWAVPRIWGFRHPAEAECEIRVDCYSMGEMLRGLTLPELQLWQGEIAGVQHYIDEAMMQTLTGE